MKKQILGLGSLSIIALSPISIVSCSEVSMSKKVQKDLGYLDSNDKPNLELKLNLKDGKVFEVINFKPIKDFVENDDKIKNADVASFVTKQLKITEKFDTIVENFTKLEFEKTVKAYKIELKNGKVIVEFQKPDKSDKPKLISYGKKRFDLKDFTIEADTVKTEILDKIQTNDIEITSIDKPKANFESKISEKTDLGKLLNQFEELTTAKFAIEFVSATDATGNVKADTDSLVKTDKVTVKIAIKDLTSASAVTISDIVIA